MRQNRRFYPKIKRISVIVHCSASELDDCNHVTVMPQSCHGPNLYPVLLIAVPLK